MTRSYYEDHSLTIARHPSETDIRMIVRIIAFALNAHEQLKYGKGLSSPDEPDLWETDLTGQVRHWIDLGQPTEKRIRQACGKASKVSIYTYQKGAALPWFEGIKSSIERFSHLKVTHLILTDESLVPKMLERTMQLSCSIEDDQLMLSDQNHSLIVHLNAVK